MGFGTMSRLIVVCLMMLTSLALGLGATSAHAVIDGVTKVYIDAELKTCWNGKKYTNCPPEPGTAIPGWAAVTTPLDATGSGIRIDIGGGNLDHADLSTFDPGVLTPGSVVNLFHRAQPYTHKLLFFTDGTEANPIRIHGVTDVSGNQPVVECEGATTVHSEDWSMQWLAPYGCWVLSYSRTAPYSVPGNDGPSWLTFSSITMQGARSVNTFDGGTQYVEGVPPIRVANGAHLKFESMRFLNSDNGLFFASNYAIDHAEVRGSLFENNGTVGSYLHHNLYFQAVSSNPEYKNIVEGNTFRRLRTGALGLSGMKQRGTDAIFRYNTIECWERCLDIVEAQDSLPAWIWANFSTQDILDRYRSVHVYGNAFYANDLANSYSYGGVIHVGMDTTEAEPDNQTFNPCCAGSASGQPMARGYGAPAYFYHNTIYINAASAGAYRQGIFDLDAGGGGGQSRYPGTLIAANNVIKISDTAGSVFVHHALRSGTINYQGVNHINVPNAEGGQIFEGYDVTTADIPAITVLGTPVITYTSAGDPDYVLAPDADYLQVDLSLQPGSPAIGAAGALPAAVAAYPVLLQPVRAALGGGATLRATTNNLGAFE